MHVRIPLARVGSPARRVGFAVLLLGMMLAAGRAAGVGMRVQPGGLLLQDVPVGEKHRLRVPLMVFNDDDRPHLVEVSAHRPSQVGGACPVGYAEIPDPRWFSFSKDVVEVPANGTASVRMFTDIPDDDRWKNRHWSVGIAVRSKPAQGQVLSLALYPRFDIETVADAEVPPPPAGECGVVPSVIEVVDVQPGAVASASLALWNTTGEKRRCTLRVLARPEEEQKPLVPLSGGISWLPDASWVALSRSEVVLEPRAPRRIELEVLVPEEGSYAAAWEGIILAEFDEARTQFCRLRIRTVPKEKETEAGAREAERDGNGPGGGRDDE